MSAFCKALVGRQSPYSYSLNDNGPRFPRTGLFPTLLVPTVSDFLEHCWILNPLQLSHPMQGKEANPWPFFLHEVTLFSVLIQLSGQMAVARSSLERGQMASPFWLSQKAVFSQDCPCINEGIFWPPADFFFLISRLVQSWGRE